MSGDETVLSTVLRGDETRWPFLDDQAARRFLEAAARHGVQPLIARQLRRGVLSNTPALVQQSLARAAVQQAVIEQRLAMEVRRVVDALARAGVRSLLMKGSALAYTHYPHPCLRPRTDTDLVVRRDDVTAVSHVFEELKYEALNMTRGDFVMYQRSYSRTDRLGIRHVDDVHWKIANPQLAADLLSWDELERGAIAVSALGEHARALGDVHALLLACVHRIAHHHDSPRLLWLYDIHLLASRLSEEQLQTFMSLAVEKGAAPMCVHSLEMAGERFGTRLPRDLREHLTRRPADSAIRFDHDVRMVDILVSDLKALPGWRQRLRLLREHVLPPSDYIRRRYGVSNPLALPLLYAYRCLTGAFKWLRPAASTDPFA